MNQRVLGRLINLRFAILSAILMQFLIAENCNAWAVNVSCAPGFGGWETNTGTCTATVTGENASSTQWSHEPSDALILGDYEALETTSYTCAGTYTNVYGVYVTATVNTASGNQSDSFQFNCYPEGGGSPIVLDLDRNQFHFSAGPVLFDIDADGGLELITWTSAGELDGFLYLDRNGNGQVDDGSELFGNATSLMDGSLAPHGYAALAEFDLPEHGGVEDGVIDDSDLVFADLRVWIDINADGIFEQHESLGLADVNVLAIELEYRLSPRTDPHGNHLRFIGRGWTEVNGKAKKMWTTDVFFKVLAE